MPWEDLEPIFRPKTVHMGVMRVDPEKCTRPRGSKCQYCWDNCRNMELTQFHKF